MSLLRSAAALAVGLSAALPAWASDYPNRPITLIVPWIGGTTTDIHLRALAAVAEKKLKQPIVIDLKPGAAGTLGPATMAASAKPDGYTLSQLPVTVFRMPAMQKVSYDPAKDFTYIIHVTGYLFNTSVKADAPWQTFRAFLDYAKANPGKVTYGTPGTGSTLHITMEQIAMQEGIKFTHVPFRSEGEAVPAMLGEHVVACACGSALFPLVESKQARILVVWSKNRAKRAPDVPTLVETGHKIVSNSPYGIGGPKGMDPEIVRKLHDVFKESMDDPMHLRVLEQLNQEIVYMNTADYTKFAMDTIVEQRELISQLGLGEKK